MSAQPEAIFLAEIHAVTGAKDSIRHRTATELRRLHEVNATALRLLAKIFDAYENGDQCYDKPEGDIYIGNAVNLGDESDQEIIDFLEKHAPPAAIDAAIAKAKPAKATEVQP